MPSSPPILPLQSKSTQAVAAGKPTATGEATAKAANPNPQRVNLPKLEIIGVMAGVVPFLQ